MPLKGKNITLIVVQLLIIFILVPSRAVGLAATASERTNNSPIAGIVLLLLDEEADDNPISVDQANKGFALAGTKHNMVFSVDGVEQANIEARPSSPNSSIKSYFGGGVEYSISSFASPGTETLEFKVFNREMGNTKNVSVQIEVIPTRVILEGNVGSEGGQLSNEWQDFVLTVPEDAVDSTSEIRLLEGTLPDGRTMYGVTSTSPLQKALQLRTPRNLSSPSNLSSQTLLDSNLSAKSKISSSKVVWRTNFANEVSVSLAARVLDSLFQKDTPLFLENLVSQSVDSTTVNHTGVRIIENQISSELVSYCGGISDLENMCGTTKPAVLLIHGYTPFGLGGGADTWGKLVDILKADGYPVFEFNWNTSSTFKRSASELANAVDILNKQTNKKIHIVAHSFGGVLSRTYLQGFAENGQHGGGVASLVTIGTPHSGIFSTDDVSENTITGPIVPDSEAETRLYPRGQDLSLPLVSSFFLNVCTQFSCHQAGEPVNNAFTPLLGGFPPNCELPPSISSTPPVCAPGSFLETNLSDAFGVDQQSGMAIHRIQTDHPEYQIPVPTLALMSLIMDRPISTTCEQQTNFDRFLEGDGLITFSGQRFHFDSGSNSFVTTTNNNETGVHIEERLLGLNVQNSLPSKAVDPSDVFYIDASGNCVADHFEGYYHAEAMGDARALRAETSPQRYRRTSPFSGTRDIRTQANIDGAGFDVNLNSVHATYEEVSSWLNKFGTELFTLDFVTLHTKVVNASDGTAVSNARFILYSGNIPVGEETTDSQGNVSIEFPRSTSKYYFSVKSDGYRQYDNVIGFQAPEAPADSVEIAPINLHPDIISYGTLAVRPIHAIDKYYLSGVEYRISRNSNVWSGTTGAEGVIEIPDLVRGNYEVLLEKEGYLSEQKTISVLPTPTEQLDVDMKPSSAGVFAVSVQDSSSFTKIDQNGDRLESSDSTWSCVKDERTGLFWEAKTNEGGLHDKSNRFRWGGYTAMNRGIFPQVGNYYSDWNDLVVQANAIKLCGLGNWRVPNRSELRSIVDFRKHEPAINSTFFPFIDNTGLGSIFWTNEVYPNNPGQVWALGFGSGFGANVSRSPNLQLPVMLVSGGKNGN